MNALMPAASMTSLRKEMDRLFDRLWQGDGLEFTATGEWSPCTDFSETRDRFVVKLEIPGIEPKDVQVAVQNGMLTVKGDKKKETEEKDAHFYRIERSYGSFIRSVRLPAAVDETKVNATFRNGMLTIILPKTAEAKGTTVPIKVE